MGDDWRGIDEHRREVRAKRRNSLRNMVNRLKLADRCEFPNEGTVLVDGRFYYYAQSKKARVKGSKTYRQMRGFQHFVDEILTYGHHLDTHGEAQ